MSSFEPFINILIVLTVLSIAAERATNFIKLRNTDLREPKGNEAKEKDREHKITIRTLLVGIATALLVKANLFEMLSRVDAPWDTLGWIQQSDAGRWVNAAALTSLGTVSYAMLGCAITGVALGFGSKFWHEILDSVVELRGIAKKTRQRAA